MPSPISALDRTPNDLIREVSPDAMAFYADELSGLFLPDEFRSQHEGRFSVKSWSVEDRLQGKFGRFALRHAEEDSEGNDPLDDILVMGTTIGLTGLDRDGYMESLRHRQFISKVREILKERDLLGKNLRLEEADYGATSIRLENGAATTVSVSGISYDYGRADTEGRQETCDVFTQRLGGDIKIVNLDPEPGQRDRILD